MSPPTARPGHAVLVCHRGPSAGYQAEWTYWDSTEQARESEANLTHPCCGPLCIGIHSVVSPGREPGRRRTAGRPQMPT